MSFFDGIGDFFEGIAGPVAGAVTSMIPGVGPFLAPVASSVVGGLVSGGGGSPQPGLAGRFMPGVGGMGQQGAQQPMVDPLALANMNYVNAHRIQPPIKKEANYFGDGLNGLSGRYFV